MKFSLSTKAFYKIRISQPRKPYSVSFIRMWTANKFSWSGIARTARHHGASRIGSESEPTSDQCTDSDLTGPVQQP